MFVHNNSEIPNAWENFIIEMIESIGKSHGKNGNQYSSHPMETGDGAEWKQNVNLRCYPTKPEDLHVKLDGNKLVLSGKNMIWPISYGTYYMAHMIWKFRIVGKIQYI